jgi:hypothetical protein
MSQKIVLFITTAVRTSNLKENSLFTKSRLVHLFCPRSTSSPVGTGFSFCEVKRPGCEADHSLKVLGAIPPLPHKSLWYVA